MSDHDELLARARGWHLARHTNVATANLIDELADALRAALAAQPQPLFEGTWRELLRQGVPTSELLREVLVYPAAVAESAIPTGRHPPETTMTEPTAGESMNTPTPTTENVSHQPDSPFGCTTMWGGPIHYNDMGTHVCNLPGGHRNGHKCKCGASVSDMVGFHDSGPQHRLRPGIDAAPGESYYWCTHHQLPHRDSNLRQFKGCTLVGPYVTHNAAVEWAASVEGLATPTGDDDE